MPQIKRGRKPRATGRDNQGSDLSDEEMGGVKSHTEILARCAPILRRSRDAEPASLEGCRFLWDLKGGPKKTALELRFFGKASGGAKKRG